MLVAGLTEAAVALGSAVLTGQVELVVREKQDPLMMTMVQVVG